MQDHSNVPDNPASAGFPQLSASRSKPNPIVLRDAGEMPGSAVEADGEDFAVTVRRYVRIFLKRKWLIAGSALCCVVLGGLSALMQTPLYTSSVTIQIDREPIKVVEGGATTPTTMGDTTEQRTQLELLKSRAMSERVVTKEHLQDDEDFLKPRNASLLSVVRGAFSGGKQAKDASAVDRTAAAVGLVATNIAIQPVAGSRLVTLSFTDPSPARAQRIAAAYADAYVNSAVEKRFDANSYARTFLDDQIKQMKLKLSESENLQIEFAEREKIVEVNDKTSIAENNLSAANAALGQLISDRIKNEQLWRQVENATAINIPQLLTNSVIDGLRLQRNTLKREYEEKLETFKPSYPAMVEILNKIKEIDRQLAAEVTTIKSSLKAAYESSLSQENEMKTRIETLRAEVLDLQKKGIRYNILKRDAETNRGIYNSLSQRYKEVDIASGVSANNIFVVDRALVPGSPSEPRISRIILLALVLGLAAGIGAAYVLELFDDRVRLPEDVEQISGLSTLGIIPLVQSGSSVVSELKDPQSAVSEAYRSLATALQFSTESGLPRSIAITSAGPGEGKSSTAVAIARHFANLGMKVLLVDADMRKPSLHEKLGQDNTTGLSNYLTGAATPPDVLQKTDNTNIAFIASGPMPPNAGDLLGGTRIFSLLSVGAEVFDLIILDTPPMIGLTDAQLISSAAAATIFVVGAGQSRKSMVQVALRRLQLARTTPIGAVLTKFDNKIAGYGYGYAYGYGYGYGYGGEAPSTAAPVQPHIAEDEKPQLRATA